MSERLPRTKVGTMSADWFCKIGEKKVGPLNGQQLKTIVAKGQLRPEHLVRQGSEGPWVPAGRIKGLFPKSSAGSAQPQGKKSPQATAKPSPNTAAKPGTPPMAKAASLPTAAEAPAPPPADVPQELRLGEHHKHHVQLNVDRLNIDTKPVNVSRRRVRAGLKGMKQDERKKLTMVLLCLIGGGMTFGLIVFIWAIVAGPLSHSKTESKTEEPNEPLASAPPVDSGQKVKKDAAEKKPVQDKEPEAGRWPRVQVKETLVGNVEVIVLKPTRGAPPRGAKTKETDVLDVPVRLNLKKGEKKPVELKSWADESLRDKVLLVEDNPKHKCDLLDQVADSKGDGKTITKDDWLIVHLIFEAPTDKMKYLHLKLPAAALHADGPTIYYEIPAGDVQAPKTDEGDSGQGAKSDKKKPGKAKAADADAESN